MASSTPAPQQPSRSWRQRLRRLIAQLRGGDTIMANVGAGASDVIVGKNIVKIGTLVVPTLPVIITLCALLGGGAAALWLALVPATMPPERFNVAIAEFSAIDAAGRERVDANSALVSKTLFTTLQSELAQLPADYQTLLWHDSLSLLHKRTTIGTITGATPAERSAAACRRAESLGANLIVFGVLDAQRQPATLRLQFCVRNTNLLERDLGSLAEIQKADRLGSPLQLQLPLRDVQSSVNPELRARTILVAKLIVGLRYELADNRNLQGSLARALGVFTDADAFLRQEFGSGSRANGGDLVAYFVGREQFLLAQATPTDDPAREERLAAAQTALARAVALNPEFARALTALGGVHFLRAQDTAPAERLAGTDLAAALESYTAAIAAAAHTGDSAAEAEAHLTFALALRLRAEALLFQAGADVPGATDALAQADREIDAGTQLTTPAQQRLRGFAAMVRGLVAEQRAQLLLRAGDTAGGRAQYEAARAAYGECAAASTSDPGDQFLRQQIADATCTPRAEKVTATLLQLSQ